MKVLFTVLICLYSISQTFSAPVRNSKDLLLVPATSYVPVYTYNPLPGQLRGPFDFIGNWIQSSEWFPIEVNVPDSIAGVGSNIGNFAQNVGNGFNSFTSNVGNGFNAFTQNFGNGFSNFAQQFGNNFRNITQRIPFWNRPNAPAKYFVLMPVQGAKTSLNSHVGGKIDFNPFADELPNIFP